jgi:hypothetical protein
MKRRKIGIILVLTIVMVIIWFFNAGQIASIKKHESTVNPKSHDFLFSPESIHTPNFTFTPLNRDPFNVVIDTMPKEPIMPQLSLRGVILAKDGALALMELSDGNVYPMKKGETYLGVKINKITPKEVVVVFRGKKTTFTVWE